MRRFQPALLTTACGTTIADTNRYPLRRKAGEDLIHDGADIWNTSYLAPARLVRTRPTCSRCHPVLPVAVDRRISLGGLQPGIRLPHAVDSGASDAARRGSLT